MREALDVSEEVLTDIGYYALTGPLKDKSLHVGRYERDYENTRVDSYCGKEVGKLKATLLTYGVCQLTEDERRNYFVRYREYHQDKHHDKVLCVGLCVFEKAADDLRVLHIAVKTDSLLFVLHKGISQNENDGKERNYCSYNKKRIKLTH